MREVNSPRVREWANRIRSAWCSVGLALFFLVALDLSLRAFYGWVDSNRAPGAGDYRVSADVYSAADRMEWVTTHYAESRSLRASWAPYVYYRIKPFHGSTISTDDRGNRSTWSPPDVEKAPRVFVLGGSTVWGTGVQDSGTLPSQLSKRLAELGRPSRVTNLGASGWVTTQDLLWLITECRRGNAPDVAVFYSGVNDAAAAWKQGIAGTTQGEHRRAAEFNLLYHPDRFPRPPPTSGIGRAVSQLRKQLGFRSVARWSPPSYPGASIAPGDLAKEVVRVYLENLRLALAVARLYGVRCLFYWQPVIFCGKTLTAYEQRQADVAAPMRSLFLRIWREAQGAASKGQFRDLSNVFAGLEEAVYVDFCHLGPRGNRIVARAIARDLLPLLAK